MTTKNKVSYFNRELYRLSCVFPPLLTVEPAITLYDFAIPFRSSRSIPPVANSSDGKSLYWNIEPHACLIHVRRYLYVYNCRSLVNCSIQESATGIPWSINLSAADVRVVILGVPTPGLVPPETSLIWKINRGLVVGSTRNDPVTFHQRETGLGSGSHREQKDR